MLFPEAGPGRTTLLLDTPEDRLPLVRWLGVGADGLVGGAEDDGSPAGDALGGALGLLGDHRGVPLLVEHAHAVFERPGLRGHRLAAAPLDPADSRDVAGRAWTTRFVPSRTEVTDDRLVVEAGDADAALALRTEVEALPGGALRARHVLTNHGTTPYLLEGLEVSVPLPDDATEVLDLTGRHERERSPQRHAVTDGAWLRESREGRPGLDATGWVAAGTPGFGFGHGRVVLVSVACAGNAVHAVQRGADGPARLVGGELLLPGEVVLRPGDAYTSPWVVVVASGAGLDPAAHALHAWQRTLPAHPARQPVTLNVWEAVYFDHDEPRLRRLADLAARVGVERFVLDDGWFLGRRDDTAGLGDWEVDPAVWPDGLGGLIEHVHGLGMEFGLWFEPEMVNPDSELYRAHPDWALGPAGRVPRLERDQLVVDLTDPEAWTHVRDRVDAVLTENAVDYVKWDHNRQLLEAGSARHGGAPAVHAQARAFESLLDDLRSRHPGVAWESCASGGGRVDLATVERVQRFWTSDMTDPHSRQHIQRWTGQHVAPEYLGAHVAAPVSHQTSRASDLDFRAATAFFLAMGIEWDLTAAGEEDLDRLADWVALHREHRGLLHTGLAVRLDVPDPAVLAHGVVAADGSEAVLAHVQLDESTHQRGVTLRVPHLERTARYTAAWLGPVDDGGVSHSPRPRPEGPTGGREVSGAWLADAGLWVPRRRPQRTLLAHLTRVVGGVPG